MQDARVAQDSFESGRGGYDVARGIEEGIVGGAENFRGAATENDIFGLHVVFLRERGNHLAVGFVGVTIGEWAAIGQGRAGLRALSGEGLARLLDSCAVAAGLTCGRAGADPPTAAELGHALYAGGSSQVRESVGLG